MTQGITKKCIACGEDMFIPLVGIKNPRPSSRVPLCERPDCTRARGIRQAQASVAAAAEYQEKMGAINRQIRGHDKPEGPVVEIETSVGTKIRQVRADDVVDDLEDIEKIKERDKLNERTKGKKFSSLATPSPERPKQPAYLKSLTQMVVPSADPEAPFGRDENGKPLVAMRSDQEIAATLLTKPHLAPGICPHKNDPTCCTLCGTKNVSVPAIALTKPLPEDEETAKGRQLAQATAFFGVRPKRPQSVQKSTRTIHSFRELLVMDRWEVASLFDSVIGVEWLSTGEKVLMDKSTVEQQAADLKREIDELRALLVTRSAQWQKIHRPDDKLEKDDRERLKREETKQLHAKEAEWRTLRSRLLHWETDPRNYVDAGKKEPVFITFADKYPITFTNIKTDNGRWLEHESANDELGYVQLGNDYDLDGYLKALQLGDDALHMMANGMTWDGWREFENRVITQAIELRLIEPDKELVELYPGLGLFVPPYDPHEDSNDGAAENQLALKTGGAQYGGSIYGAGKRIGKHRNYARRIADFTRTMDYGNKSPEFDDGSRSYVPDNSDDREGWDPN